MNLNNIIIISILLILLFVVLIRKNNTTEYFEKYKPAEKVVYVLWTGNNDMSLNRQKCYDSIVKNIGVKVMLITPKNINTFILKDHPFHPAYKYLSHVHKSDYLRTYLMHHYGGGYSDIKQTDTNWNDYFDNLNNSDNWCNGYTEISGGSASLDKDIQQHYSKYIGNCSYIFKPYTPLTYSWYNKLHIKLDKSLEKLKKQGINNNSREDILPWAFLLGEHFHDCIKPYTDKVLHDLPIINTNNYQ